MRNISAVMKIILSWRAVAVVQAVLVLTVAVAKVQMFGSILKDKKRLRKQSALFVARSLPITEGPLTYETTY